MKKYETPDLILVRFSAEDILTYSNEFDLPVMPVGNDDSEDQE